MRKEFSEAYERRKRRREIVVAVIASILIGLIFYYESEVARSSEHIPLGSHLLLFGLLTVVTLLLILVIFFLIRNLFKLVFERRRKVLGVNLKTRLTMALVALTLIPTVVLFMASAGVLHNTIESWFTTQVEDSLQSALFIAQAFYQNASERAIESGAQISKIIQESNISNVNDLRKFVNDQSNHWISSLGLGAVHFYFTRGSEFILYKSGLLDEVNLPAPNQSFVKIGLQGEQTSMIIGVNTGGDIVRGVSPLRIQKSSEPLGAIVTDYYIPTSLSGRLFGITSAFGDYQEARRMKGPIKTTYILILLMVALLVIFIGFWFGLSMARDITDPIQNLAEGTARIASGDLDVNLDSSGEDELGQLVDSFNKMASDLRKSRDELMRVNLDLDNRRKYMEAVLTNVAAGVLALDANNRITTANESAIRLLKLNKQNLLGDELSKKLPGEASNSLKLILEELYESSDGAIERHLKISFPEKVITLMCFANILKDEIGNVIGVVLVFEDLTYLVKAQRMAAWREVARRIAHEIKNPLTPIQLNAQRIRRKYLENLGTDGATLDQCTSSIIKQVDQLKNMVNEFSKFARMPTANPTPTDLNALIMEVGALYESGNDKVRFDFLLSDQLPLLDLDREQFKRVMANLLDNSVSAIGDNGHIAIKTNYDASLSIATIEVIDNGRGVPVQDRERIFDPYFTRKSGGTGLGLTIVNAIISDHNGFIRVKDGEDGGACFVVELPVKRTIPSSVALQDSLSIRNRT